MTPSSATRIRACRRETFDDATLTRASGARPMMCSPSVSGTCRVPHCSAYPVAGAGPGAGSSTRGRAERVAEAVHRADIPRRPHGIAKGGAHLVDQARERRASGDGVGPQQAAQLFLGNRIRPPFGEHFEQTESPRRQGLHLPASPQLAHRRIENAVPKTESH